MRGDREHERFLNVARLAENIGFDTETENNLVYILDFVDFFFSFFKLEVKVCMREWVILWVDSVSLLQWFVRLCGFLNRQKILYFFLILSLIY